MNIFQNQEGQGHTMAILIDRTSGPTKRYNINVCHYCNSDKYPRGKPIMSEDKHARHTDKGDWKCGSCVAEDLIHLLNRQRRMEE